MVLGLGTIGLGVVRALGEQGIRVSGLYWDSGSVAVTSRYCERAVACPHPALDPRRVLELLLAEARRHDTPAVLLPVTDVFLDFLIRHEPELRGSFLFTLAEPPLRGALLNKRLQYRLAAQVGMPCPRTFFPADGDDLDRVAREVQYPALLKPALSHLWYPRFLNRGIRIDGPEELTRGYAEHARHGLELMVQSFVLGPVSNEYVQVAYLDGSGSVLARFTQRKLRQFPPELGVSTLAESVRDDEVERLGLDFLRRIRFHGPAAVQMKRDDRDGHVKLLELNGRLVQDNIHPTRCGVNLPLLSYLDLTGQTPAPLAGYRVGVRHLDLVPDIQGFLASRGADATWKLAPWLRSLASARVFAHFDARDPLPFLVARRNELPRAHRLARNLWRKARGRLTQSSA